MTSDNKHKFIDLLMFASSVLVVGSLAFVIGAGIGTQFRGSKPADSGTNADKLLFRAEVQKTYAPKTDFEILAHRLTNLETAIERADTDKMTNTWTARIQLMKADLDSIRGRLDHLERGLMENPEKAMSLPLLRKDLDANSRNHEISISSLREKIEELNDSFRKIFGALSALALSLIPILANYFLNRQKAT